MQTFAASILSLLSRDDLQRTVVSATTGSQPDFRMARSSGSIGVTWADSESTGGLPGCNAVARTVSSCLPVSRESAFRRIGNSASF